MFDAKAIEKIKTHILCPVTFFLKSRLYEVTWKNTEERGRAHVTIWRMRLAWWIPKATNTHSGCVLLIVFPPQQRLHELT
jgi:hypothetical protein